VTQAADASLKRRELAEPVPGGGTPGTASATSALRDAAQGRGGADPHDGAGDHARLGRRLDLPARGRPHPRRCEEDATIASSLADLGKGQEFGNVATNGAPERAVLRLLSRDGDATTSDSAGTVSSVSGAAMV
jgi:hypothetical protein